MRVIDNMQERFTASLDGAFAAYDERVAAGTQPSTPGATPGFLIFANAGYVLVTAALDFAMQRREKGFEIKGIITVYNLSCVIAAGYCAVHIILYKYQHPGSLACNALVEGPDGQHLAWVFWVFYAQKFWEFLDTWFFILRRSFRQVTFLHLFHHSSITVVVGSILRFDYSGDMFLPILLNSIVHVLMYSHYFVTALGIKSWWRQHLTTLQLCQFVLISVQSYIAYNAGPSCGAPDWAKLIMILYMASMLVLFGNFFMRRYVFNKSEADMCGVIKGVEHPDAEIYNGIVQLNKLGEAVVSLPPWFNAKRHRQRNDHFSYQVRPLLTAALLAQSAYSSCR